MPSHPDRVRKNYDDPPTPKVPTRAKPSTRASDPPPARQTPDAKHEKRQRPTS